MNIDVTAQRNAIAAALEGLDVQVFPAAPHGTLPSQFVLVGMPSWRPPTEALCMDIVGWEVMVCVGRSGTNDTITALTLEGLWPQVLTALDAAVDGGAFNDVCTVAFLREARFETVVIQGKELPAQVLTLEMQGA